MRIIDTSILIDYFRGVSPARDIFFENLPVISIVSVHEICTGLKFYNKEIEVAFFLELFENIDIINFSMQEAKESSSLAAQLRRKGITLNALDLMIAGTAIAHDIKEIASKDSHFYEIEKISDIKIISYNS